MWDYDAEVAGYIGMDADYYARIDVLPAGAAVEIPDWDEGETATPVIWITDGERGCMVGGSKAQIVGLLESALQQAWSLPDDPEGEPLDV